MNRSRRAEQLLTFAIYGVVLTVVGNCFNDVPVSDANAKAAIVKQVQTASFYGEPIEKLNGTSTTFKEKISLFRIDTPLKLEVTKQKNGSFHIVGIADDIEDGKENPHTVDIYPSAPIFAPVAPPPEIPPAK